MKNLFKLAAFSCGIILLAAGCSKGIVGSDYTSGPKVKFSATSGKSSASTKATYSGVYADGDNDTRYERIDWEEGDEFAVWSDKASVKGLGTKHNSNYKIMEVTASGRYSQAKVGNISEDTNGLWWDESDETLVHSFYAVYPATTPYDTTKNTITGAIPANQNVSLGRTGFKIKDTTDLSTNGYMVAGSKQKHTDHDGKVPLDFYPAFTAFEVQLKSAADPVEIYSCTLTSESQALAGSFTGTLGFSDSDAFTYSFDCSSASTTKLTKTFGTEGNAPTITTDSTLIFTFLALPQDFDKLLTLTFDTNKGEKSIELTKTDDGDDVVDKTYNPIKFEGCKKHILMGLAMPSAEFTFSVITLDVAAADWTDVEYETEYTNVISTNQFAVKNATMAREYLKEKEGVDYKYARQTWICTSGTDTKVTFKVLSPQNSKWQWTIKPNGDFDAFSNIRVKTNEGENGTTRNITDENGVSGNLVDDNPTYFTIHFTPSSTTDYKVMYFTVLLTDPDGNVINIDFTTQLYERRGYHYFVLNASDDQLKELNKDVFDK